MAMSCAILKLNVVYKGIGNTGALMMLCIKASEIP